MNPVERTYCEPRRYVHSWPGQVKTHYKGRAGKSRAVRKAQRA